MTVDEFLGFAGTLESSRLETQTRRAGFEVALLEQGLEITPESSGVPRFVHRNRIQQVLEEYARTGSMVKRDYQKISFDASYLLTIIGLAERLERLGAGPERAGS